MSELGRGELERHGSKGQLSTGPKLARWVLVGIAGAIVVFAILVAQASPNSPNAVAPTRLVGALAPPIVGSTISGSTFSLAHDKNDYVLVNFFASWCVPCRTETTAFKKFLSLSSGQPWGARIKLVGVTVNDRKRSVDAFASGLGITWPVVFDQSGEVALAYGVQNPPQTFLVAPNGKVITRIVGGVTTGGLMALVNLAYSTYR